MAGKEKSTRIVKKLRQNEERYRELFDSINVCVAVFKVRDSGADFIIKDLNTAAENVEKISRREAIGKSILEVFPGIKELGITEMMQRVWETEAPESFPPKFYQGKRTSGWREGYIYKLPSGDIVTVYEDITERKKAEAALAEAELRYRTVADFTYDWEYWRSPEGKYLYVSPSCERISGYTPAQFLKDPGLMEKIIVPADRKAKAAHLEKVEKHIEDSAVFRIKCKGGGIRWIEHICRPIMDSQGKYLGSRGSNRDITDRRQAEEKHREIEEKYRLLAENSEDVIWILGMDLRYTYLSPSAKKLRGYTPEESMRQDFASTMTPESLQAVLNTLEANKARIENRNYFSVMLELELYHKDGSTVPAEVNVRAIYDDKGQPAGFIGVTRDISQRKKAEQKLKESEEKYRLLAENMDDVVWMAGTDMHFTYLSPAISKLRGFTAEEVMEQPLDQVITPESMQRLMQEFERAEPDLKKGRSISLKFEAEQYCKDGSTIWTESLIRPMYDDSRVHTGYLGVTRDISDRHQAEQELQQSEEKYRTVVENAFEGIIIIQDGMVKFINRNSSRELGIEFEDAYARPFLDFIHPDDRRTVIDRYTHRLKGETLEDTKPFRLVGKGGELWVEGQMASIQWQDKPASLVFLTNIDARRRAEESLRESEERYRTILEQTQEAYYEIDINGHFTFFNDALLTLMGYKREELLGMGYRKYVPAGYLPTTVETYQEVYRTGKPCLLSKQARIRKDGSIIYVELSAFPIRNMQGEFTGFRGIARDITARLKVEEALRESEEKFRMLAENSADAIWTLDTKLNVTYISPSIIKILGVTPEEISQYRIEDSMTPASLQRVTDTLERYRSDIERGTEAIVQLEVEHRHRDGSPVWAEMSIKALYDDQGRHSGFIGTTRDISQRKQAEQSLRQSEEKYRLLAENSLDCIWTLDRDLRLTYISPSLEKIRGVTPAEAMRETIQDSMTPQSQMLIWTTLKKNQDEMQRGTEKPVRLEIEHYHKNGSTVWVEMVLRALYDKEGRLSGFLGASRDITERKKVQQALLDSEEKYRLLAENTVDAIWTMDPHFRLTYMSPAIRKLRGIEPQEALRETIEQALAPGSLPDIMKVMQRSRQAVKQRTERIARLELEHYRRDGSTVWLEVAARALYDKEGKHTGYIGISRDITERKWAEQLIKASEAKFAASFMATSDPTAITDIESSKIVDINPAWERWTGYSREEVLGHSTNDLNIWPDPGARDRMIESLLKQGKLIDMEGQLRTKEGQLRDVLFSATIIDTGGKKYLFSRVHDITLRRTTEKALEKVNHQLADMINFLPDATLVIDRDSKVIMWNRAIEKITGIAAAEMVGKGGYAYSIPFYGEARPALVDLVLHNMEDVTAMYPEIRRVGDSLTAESFCPAVNEGKGIWAFAKASPLHDREGNIVGAIESIRDITDKRRYQENLRQSEEQYRLLAENADDCIWTMDKTLKQTYISPGIRKIRGIDPAEAMNETIKEQHTPESYQSVRLEFKQLLEEIEQGTARTHTVTAEQYHRDGTTVWVESTVRPYYDGAGSLAGFIGVSRDVTERLKAEKSIQQASRRLEDIIGFLPDATMAIDKDGTVILWNRAMEKMTGIPAAEMIGKGNYAYSVPFYGDKRPFLMDLIWEDSEELRLKYPYIMKDGDSFFSEVFCPSLYGGKGAWVLAKASPLHDREGNIIGTIESIRDINEEKLAEQNLQQSEEQYRLLAENTEDVIWTVDRDFIYTYVSPAIFKLRGFKPEEIVGQSMTSTLTPEAQAMIEQERERNRDFIGKGIDVTMRYELHTFRKDGSTLWTEAVVKTLYDGDRRHIGFIGTSRDITERKAAEAALRESETKYSDLLENAGEGILVAQDGLIKFVNKQMTEMVKYSSAEVTNTPFINYIHPDDAQLVLDTHLARMRGESVTTAYSFRVVTSEGQVRWIELHATPITWEGRTASLNFLQDITERRQAEQALIESEKRYRLLAENTDDVIWTMDRDLNLTYVSPSIYRLRGLAPDEAVQEKLEDSLAPQSMQRIRNLFDKNLSAMDAGKSQSIRLEIEQSRKDGTPIWVELDVKSLHDKTGKLTGFQGSARDITQRKLAEKALIESEEKFRNIFQQSSDAIFISDRDGNLIDINESLCALTGYSREELLQMTDQNLEQDRSWLLSVTADVEDSLRNYEYTIKRKDGKTVNVIINTSVRRDSAGNIIGHQGIMHDVTERKRWEEEIQKTSRLESIGTLAGGIAHDFNNILGAVIGNISLAKTELSAGHSAHDLLKDAEKAVMRARELTGQLLTFARGGAPVKKIIPLGNTIKDTANFAVRGTSTVCRFNIAADLLSVDADEGQISQVIHNLVLNARQAMPSGGDIEIAAENISLDNEQHLGRTLPLPPGKYVRITVKDYGTGIQPEHIGRIFDPYFTTKQSGSGLGLATCYSIIKNHGGHISVYSHPGKGSTFYIYLPAAAERVPDDREKEGQREEARMSGRILVMDDEAALRTTIASMLKRLGCEHVVTAASGEEALDIYRDALQAQEPFDLVILDLTVPGGMGGKETMEKLCEMDPSVTAVVSSGYANEAIMSEYTSYGFKGVIVKPYTFDELRSILQQILNKPEPS
ncbi:MAG: PAS domain S-box protein [Dehalococcoidia bacterium]|nr:PAS domain S-box protein [Dehalococcoidia bacterium]